MSRINLVTSSVVALLAGTALSTSLSTSANAQTLRGQITGNWVATSCESKIPIMSAVCPNITGSATYSPSGRYNLVNWRASHIAR
jgi:hypothetical protein